jgi:hypothetical protein
MIRFKDFVPNMVSPPGFLTEAQYESFDDALVAANAWINENNIQLIHIETVVLPNLWSDHETGTTDVSLETSGQHSSAWHQFIRCWYRQG